MLLECLDCLDFIVNYKLKSLDYNCLFEILLFIFFNDDEFI